MNAVRIRDIAPRLAFQAFPATTDQKVELVDRLTDAGVRAVEVSSFVNPKLVPGLADAADVFARVKRPAGVSLECCVANERGLRQAIDAGAHAAWFLLAADEQFSILNTGRTIEDSLAELARMREVAEGSGTKLGTYLIATFGGPVGMPRGPGDVHAVARRLIGLDIRDWILADSCGYAAPPQITEMVKYATGLTPIERLNLQVHDSRGMGVANVVEAARIGVLNIDTALGGSGAHPASPGALVGGTCTEDAVQVLERMGVATDVDLQSLIEAANWLNRVLGGAAMGFVRKSGAVPRNSDDTQRQAEGRSFEWTGS
ncbi:hypothetical protein [Sphingomonas sp. TREG-RG-20F-R18-01]|uniref:hypothetical protein n=1 Tax=Sphingomonas sp. TREG-RG-20F-R18-01 TaxID=2914982 RepID=UPI001F56FEFF